MLPRSSIHRRLFAPALLLFLACSSGFGQWQRRIDLTGNLVRALHVEQRPGGYLLLGTTTNFNPLENSVVFARLDETGTLQSLQYAETTAIYRRWNCAAPALGSGYILGGIQQNPTNFQQEGVISHISASGQLLFETVIGPNTEVFRVRPSTSGSGYIALANDQTGEAHLLRLTSGGIVFSDDAIEPGIREGVIDFAESPSGELLVCGSRTNPSTQAPEAVVYRFLANGAPNGLVFFQKSLYQNQFEAIVPATDGNFYLAGSVLTLANGQENWLLKMDANGQEIWSRTSGSWRRDIGTALLPTPGAGVAMTGTFGHFWGNNSMFCQQFDAAGNLLSESIHGGALSAGGTAIGAGAAGTVVIAGDFSDADIAPPGYGLFVVKTDCATVGTGTTERPIERLRAMPNPASQIAEISTASLPLQKGKWTLTDAEGRPVRTEKWSGERIRIERRGLSAGVYFFSVSDKKGLVANGEVVFR